MKAGDDGKDRLRKQQAPEVGGRPRGRAASLGVTDGQTGPTDVASQNNLCVAGRVVKAGWVRDAGGGVVRRRPDRP